MPWTGDVNRGQCDRNGGNEIKIKYHGIEILSKMGKCAEMENGRKWKNV
jgi:hypothetical protein